MNKTEESQSVNYEIKPGPELTLRQGEAIHPKDLAPPSIILSGTLSAPFNFLVGKPTLASDEESINLTISNQDGQLILSMKDKDPFSRYIITGKLEKFADLQKFKINTDQRWTIRDFKKFIRTVSIYFADKSKLNEIVESLNKFEANVETVIKQHNDNSGNSLTMLEQKVNGLQLARKFDLLIPIYKGYQKIKFTVEIGLDPKNTSVDLFLLSDELFEQEILQRESIMNDELSKFDKYKFSKVVIS
jgi:hypothetical protein